MDYLGLVSSLVHALALALHVRPSGGSSSVFEAAPWSGQGRTRSSVAVAGTSGRLLVPVGGTSGPLWPRRSPAEQEISSGLLAPTLLPEEALSATGHPCRVVGYAEKGLGVQTCTPIFNVMLAYLCMLNTEGSLTKTKVVA